jgi:hypothetical protein
LRRRGRDALRNFLQGLLGQLANLRIRVLPRELQEIVLSQGQFSHPDELLAYLRT